MPKMNCAFCRRPREKKNLVETSVKHELICHSCAAFYKVCPFCGSTDKKDGKGKHRRHFGSLCALKAESNEVVTVPPLIEIAPSDEKQLYIEERRDDINDLAYYGPFDTKELEARLTDFLAVSMTKDGTVVEAVEMTNQEAERHHINPRSYWMTQLLTLTPV